MRIRQINPFALVLFSFGVLALLTSCTSPHRVVTTKSGLRYEVVVTGNGPAAMSGRSVRIHETMTLADGTLIYSTRANNKPVQFLLGGNQVIAGVDQGVMGMRVGERRKLIVPPTLSRRSGGNPPGIPPDAVLHYDIELIEILAE